MMDAMKQRWRRPLTVRARVLAAVMSLITVGLIVAGGTAYLLQRNQVDETINDSLSRSVSEFRALAANGIDPSTLERFTTADGLVSVAMQRTVPARNEGMLGFSAGQLRYVAPGPVPLRLEDDAELVNRIEEYDPRGTIRIQSLETATTNYRMVIVPVQLSSDPTPGLFVLAFDRNAELSRVNDTFITYSLVALGSLLLIAVVCWLVAGRLLAPIRLVRETAHRIGESDLSQRIPVTGNDDLSELTRTVNAMLDRLQNAFGSQRQLLDDVGHELRTPITIVRGHMELLDVNDPADVSSTRGIALDELDRMHLLVDDLVTLANVDRPDFVRKQEIDVGELTDDVLDKARQLGKRRWIVDSRTPHTCWVDPRRITQAWLQLAANAVKFSATDSTIALGSQVTGDHLKLWVRDEGIGVEAADQERIFERFNRGSGTIRSEGSGLGLTIVSAIAKAHGGGIELESAAGVGSIFTLDLPVQERTADGAGPGLFEGQVTQQVPIDTHGVVVEESGGQRGRSPQSQPAPPLPDRQPESAIPDRERAQ